jgi:DNA-directed RNA polymerase subunit beta'
MLKDFSALKITVASPTDILNWSYGEVTKAETINYRTFKAEPAGLMAEEIFGPTRDYQCYCGKYKGIRYKGIVCDRCNVEVTHKRVRRDRMGHIKLAAPVAHVWFSNGVPNKLALILDISQKKLETVIYYARYVVTNVNDEEKKTALESIDSLKQKELAELETELNEKLDEIHANFEQEGEIAAKSEKDKKTLQFQLENIRNSEKKEAARIKSAYKQKQDNIDKKFVDLKNLVENLNIGSTLSEEEYQLLADYDLYFYEAGMGAEAVKELLQKLDLNSQIEDLDKELKETKSQLKKTKVIQRLRILKGLRKSGINPASLILDVLPVIPPDLRPIIQLPGGRFATYDLNDLYRRVINRNNRLRRLINLGAPEIILRNEKRMLQEAVDSLLDNNHKPGAPSLNSRGMPFKSLSDMLRGKQGRFRQNLLGKRVDYSGNAVIVAGPELKFHECGLPKVIALELFKPFIIRELIARDLAPNPARAKVIFDSKSDEVWEILEEVSEGRPVLLNRAPTLHRHSILGFFPKLIEGNAIRLHPMTCTGFNADFDGDQMAVHLPLSEKAVEEVKLRMMAKDNILSLRDGTPIVNVSKDMAMGIYFLTLMQGEEKDAKHSYPSIDDALADYHVGNITFFDPVKVLHDDKVIVTTAGRIMFNKILPEHFEFINKAMGKSDISKLSAKVFREFGNDYAVQVLDAIKDLGFKYAGRLGFSLSMGEFNFGAAPILEEGIEEYYENEKQLMNDYDDGMITAKELDWLKQELLMKYTEKIQTGVWNKAKENAQSLIDLNDSGAVSVSSWVKRISGVYGYVIGATGSVVNLPILNNYEKGLSNFEYFVTAKAARKSFTDVALRTSDSGYLTRRLVDVGQDIITNTFDCGSTEGVYIERNAERQQEFADRIKGRYLAEDIIDPKTSEVLGKKDEPIDLKLAAKIQTTEEIAQVKVRSAMTCNVAHGICTKCYGYDIGTGKPVEIGEAVGVIAAQALGEPTTQLTLKSRSDARASGVDVTEGLPRVEELLEARTPKALALLSEVDGVVNVINEKNKVILRITSEKKIKKVIPIEEGDEVVVKNGEEVNASDILAIKKNKKEIKAEFPGSVEKTSADKITLIGTKRIEIEKEALNISDVLVQDGQKVEKGQQLTFGSIDPKELVKLRNLWSAQKYIIDNVQKVYGIQGLAIDDRHLEIVVRQMSRYGFITTSGDSEDFLPGDYADILDIAEENKKLREQGKEEMTCERVLLGVTNASIKTESFLSAASFEQQVRVLTDAALIGKVDRLRGLKENVIIGRLVPLGDELKKKLGLIQDEEEEGLEVDTDIVEEKSTEEVEVVA